MVLSNAFFSPPPLAVLDKDFSFHTSFIPVVTPSKSLQALSKQKSKMKFYFSSKSRDSGGRGLLCSQQAISRGSYSRLRLKPKMNRLHVLPLRSKSKLSVPSKGRRPKSHYVGEGMVQIPPPPNSGASNHNIEICFNEGNTAIWYDTVVYHCRKLHKNMVNYYHG